MQIDTLNGIPLHDVMQLNVGNCSDLLEKIRVQVLNTPIAVPYSAMILSHFAAEVIKIEQPEGNDARYWAPPLLDGVDLWVLSVNRNKKSVVLGLTNKERRDNLCVLVTTSDFVISNKSVSVPRKLRLTVENFRKVNTNIDMTLIAGFGFSGARSVLTCYDLIAERHSCTLDVTGIGESVPHKVGAPTAFHEDRCVTPPVGLGIQIDLACASPRSTVPRLGDGTKAVLAHVRTLASGDHL